tara:strand:+ start:1258 stop:2112 length:855 start_codon:yes stop_codon:yes gene_type:complete
VKIISPKIINLVSTKQVTTKQYRKEKRRLQVELLKLQEWVIYNNKKIAIVFEGRDAAGKGATIKRFIEYLIPKKIKVREIGVPTKKQMKNWFKTFEKMMPKEGEIVFFDRSWYSRALIQATMGYCNKQQYKYFMNKVNNWEKKIINQKDIQLIKIYLSVSKSIQQIRFELRKNSELKYWKLSDNDIIAQNHWNLFTRFKEQMFYKTSSTYCPWIVINSNDKLIARLNAMRYVLYSLPYPNKKLLKEKHWTLEQMSNVIEIEGVEFKDLTEEQYSLLYKIKSNYE